MVKKANGNVIFDFYWRKSLLFVFQVLVVISSFFLSFGLRFDFSVPQQYQPVIYSLLPALVAIKISVFWTSGLSSGWWRYVSIPDLESIFKSNVIGSFCFAAYVIWWSDAPFPPRSVLVLDGIFCFLILSGIRILTRILRESQLFNLKSKNGEKHRVLIIGSGAVGQMIVREIRQNPHLNQIVVGFLDNDLNRKGKFFQGIKVLGMTCDLEKICRVKDIALVIIAHPAVRSKELHSILEACRKAKVQSKILPTMGALINGEVSIQHIRDVQLEDLLGRKPVHLDIKSIQEYLKGKRILITGAAGSIGSEICRQVSAFLPDLVVLFDNAETPLFHIENELVTRFPNINYCLRLSDIRNMTEVQAVFKNFAPDVVFHAAAYKHVPISEKNPVEVVGNNLFGTRNLADCAHSYGVRNFVMISTDKAVNPSNVMGASKRAAEIYVQNLAAKCAVNFVTVRFGNVLGSNGSVVPIFKDQIKRGGPVTVTHPDVTRFFMTIPEAVQLVLQAGSMGRGGEIFILDMGKPIKILRLAEELIRLSGLIAYEDIDIEFTGLRPGEKLAEELLGTSEGVLVTGHQKIRVARSSGKGPVFPERSLEALEESVKKMDPEGVLRVLGEIVPEYCRGTPERKKDPVARPLYGSSKGAAAYVEI